MAIYKHIPPHFVQVGPSCAMEESSHQDTPVRSHPIRLGELGLKTSLPFSAFSEQKGAFRKNMSSYDLYVFKSWWFESSRFPNLQNMHFSQMHGSIETQVLGIFFQDPSVPSNQLPSVYSSAP